MDHVSTKHEEKFFHIASKIALQHKYSDGDVIGLWDDPIIRIELRKNGSLLIVTKGKTQQSWTRQCAFDVGSGENKITYECKLNDDYIEYVYDLFLSSLGVSAEHIELCACLEITSIPSCLRRAKELIIHHRIASEIWRSKINNQ